MTGRLLANAVSLDCALASSRLPGAGHFREAADYVHTTRTSDLLSLMIMSASTAIPEPDTLQTLLYPAPLEKDQFRLLKCLGRKDSMLACSLNVVEFQTEFEMRP